MQPKKIVNINYSSSLSLLLDISNNNAYSCSRILDNDSTSLDNNSKILKTIVHIV